jgi:hypothetical protein
LAFDYIEEFIVLFVLVPVILTLNDCDPDYGLVDFAEGLIEPLVLAGVGKGLFVDDFEGLMEDVQAGFVGVVLDGIWHGGLNFVSSVVLVVHNG